MFALRKVFKDHTQINLNLGNEYSLVERDSNYDKFSETFLIEFASGHVADLDEETTEFTINCYAFVIGEGGKTIHPLYKNQFNYIMTESGKTFSNLTYK
jgi:hypothetical protein